MNRIAKTNVELPEYVFEQIQVPNGLPLHAGEIYSADELVDEYGNYNVYNPIKLTNITKEIPCLLLNGNFEEVSDGRRLKGNPNYGTYEYGVGEIANSVRLNVPNIPIEISIEALNSEIATPHVGNYLVPVNNSNLFNLATDLNTITAKYYLKIDAIKYFKIGGQFGGEFIPTLVCRTQMKHYSPITKDEIEVTLTEGLKEGNANVEAGATIATVAITGGTAPYSYFFNNNAQTKDNNKKFVLVDNKVNVGSQALTAGSYLISLIIKDLNNVMQTVDITVVVAVA